MALKIFQHMQNLLKKSENFTDKEGNIFVHTVLEAIENLDPEFIGLLLGDEKAKEQFFIAVEGIFVLNQNKLIEFFTMNEFSKHSYTSYSNKIGLIKKDSFIKKFDDVVLAWPHKDCILEGGQSKDDEKNNEVFYNEILSRDEIDRLFEPKALTNIKRYSVRPEPVEGSVYGSTSSPRTGRLACEESIPSDITMDDNLIIKGNNLIALHSLKKKYAGKVKLIYIDPPYNTGNDSFNYNDRFNHSTWLTFMKNRLEVARELLKDDGVIFVQCDDNEQAYLKVLMDEVFLRDKFIVNVIWKKRGGAPNDKVIGTTHENILLYSKTEKYKLNKKQRTVEQIGRYTNPDNHPKGNWLADNLMANVKGGRGVNSLYFPIINPNTQEAHYPSSNGNWRYSQETIKKLLDNDELYFGKNGLGKPKLKRFYSELKSEGISIGTFWEDLPQNNSATAEILKLFGSINEFDTPKPEGLLQRIIEIATNEGDIILDYHLGSGTTAAVAHKMNRRYIGIEQMDYIEDIAVERMKKVIEGEQGGISKAMEWSGGGSFIYAELKQIDTFKEAEIGKLNKNMHYLPMSEIEDEEYGISTEEVALSKQFYGLENE